MNMQELMKEHILGVLMYLFENHMHNDCKLRVSNKKLTAELTHAGFKAEAINKALLWLKELVMHQNIIQENPPKQTSLRVLSTQELQKINKDCQNMIMRFEKLKILNPISRELVISQLMQLGEKRVSLTDVKWVTFMVLFNQSDQRNVLWYLQHLVLNDRTANSH